MMGLNKEKAAKAIEYLNWYFTQDDGAADKNAVEAWKELVQDQEIVKHVREQIREKVILGLTVCTDGTPSEDCRKCPYQGKEYCTDAVMQDALTLLKEDEK